MGPVLVLWYLPHQCLPLLSPLVNNCEHVLLNLLELTYIVSHITLPHYCHQLCEGGRTKTTGFLLEISQLGWCKISLKIFLCARVIICIMGNSKTSEVLLVHSSSDSKYFLLYFNASITQFFLRMWTWDAMGKENRPWCCGNII